MLDGAIVIFDAVNGVEPQSETVWHQADRYKIPRLAYMNKMDRVGADFFGSVQMMRDKLGTNPLILQIPIGSEDEFRGVIDLIKMKAISWSGDDLGVTYEYGEIPDDLKDQADKYRHDLIESIVEQDDEILERYLETGEVTENEIVGLVKRVTLQYSRVPVYCGSSLRNVGVQPLIDGVKDFLPSPLEVPPIEGINLKTEKTETRECSDDEPLAALAFKIQSDTQSGILTLSLIHI